MSAMLEAFDTQMVDFQTDSDYIMQLSSSDPWSQEEATMEADGHTPLQTTIEVDMEPYDEEHHQTEYEMEDDLETVGAALNDVHDVEVYDASRFQSPDIPHDGSPITVPVHDDPEHSADEVDLHTECIACPEFGDSTSDPHEISEGVYIDPPPPVLVSLHADEPTISLFNVPSKSSFDLRLQEKSDVDLVLLLDQLPTLYYEPLSSVFEALRREEYLIGIPGLLNGELLLDAYDLKLIMSEDYTYAHDISLHDLNVLHDGLNKHGPLRLRLRTAATRFIDRYHLLQNQITEAQARENLAEKEISGVNSLPEEHSDASHGAIVEISGKESSSEEVVSGVNFSTQGEASGVDSIREVDASDTESYHDEGSKISTNLLATLLMNYGTVEGGPSVPEEFENQHDNYEAEQETEPSEDLHYPEEQGVSVESTTPIVETNNVDSTSNRDVPEFESETNDNNCSQDDDLRNPDGLDLHADDPQQLNESEQASAEVVSTEWTEIQYPDHGVESEILEHAIVPVRTQGKDIGDINDQHPDENELHVNDEGSGSDLANPVHSVVEFDLTTEVEEEQNQADSSVNAGLVATEGILDVHDDTWNDSLDGEGDWEAEGDEQEYEYEYGDEESFGHEHEVGQEHGQEHDTVSNSSSVTLSSKASFKRSLSEAELEDYQEDEYPTGSPGSKKPRVEYETF
ncbi:hypothetical protein C0992_005671 [Termitomyces sp. T32_za158]|nr:hypothetical protein C0992_005671 [Termitomyces sp. T32_za158]